MIGYNAFLYTSPHNCYVMFTDKINITDNIVKAFIRCVSAHENFENIAKGITKKLENDNTTIKYFKNNITRVKYIDTGEYHRIYNKNLDLRYPFNDKTLVFCFYH